MFLDQRQANTLMRQLDIIEEYLKYDIGPESEDPAEALTALARIRKMLTDQPLAPTAVPE